MSEAENDEAGDLDFAPEIDGAAAARFAKRAHRRLQRGEGWKVRADLGDDEVLAGVVALAALAAARGVVRDEHGLDLGRSEWERRRDAESNALLETFFRSVAAAIRAGDHETALAALEKGAAHCAAEKGEESAAAARCRVLMEGLLEAQRGSIAALRGACAVKDETILIMGETIDALKARLARAEEGDA